MSTQIVIVGKGIAALVLSFLLKQKGLAHVILERKASAKPFALAETLPPSALPLLQSIGLLQLFEENSIRKTFGYHSLWDTDHLVDNNFYFHRPYQYGLKIDKKRILNKLEKITSPTIIKYEHQLEVQINDEGVLIALRENGIVKKLNANYIVDATGRNRAILKLINIKMKDFDKSLSFSTHLPGKKHAEIKHDVFVESFNGGWGLVSGLNEKQNVLSLFTQPKSAIYQKITAYKNWSEILSATKYLKHFLAKDVNFKVRGGMSNSSKPEYVAGKNWLAIGDAALAFDPLCSHGITNAVFTAKEAMEVLEKKGDGVEYDRMLNEIFEGYLASKEEMYWKKGVRFGEEVFLF